MALIKSIKKFLKTPACGCTKKNKRGAKRSSGKRMSKRYRGGYSYTPIVTEGKSRSRSRSRGKSQTL
jgi:hypothetical protein